MIALEQYLLDKGYLKLLFDNDTNWFIQEKEGRHTISTMVNLYYWYVLPEDLEDFNNRKFNKRMFKIGLNEYKKPPTLIYPRPFIQTDEGYTEVRLIDDDQMNRILKDKTNEEVIELVSKELVNIDEI